jgi:hypothetical protein
VPERRAKDHKHRLITVSLLFMLAAGLLLLSAPAVEGTWLALVLRVLAGFFIFSAVITFWAWWDVHGDGR